MPELVVEVVMRLLLSLEHGFLVQLEVTVRNGLEFNNLRIHSPEVIDASAPLLVQLLLHYSLALVLPSALELVGTHSHLVHALLRCLLTVYHLLLVRLHLGRELARELLPPLLQLRLRLLLQLRRLALDAVGPDDRGRLVLPEALCLHLEGIHFPCDHVLVEELLLLP